MVPAGNTKRIFDGRFEVIGIVGRGSQSVVYHARHTLNPAIEVALKVLVSSPKSGRSADNLHDKLRKEALAMVSARHRYVVRIDDFHSIGDLCYLSMEYAPEGDLRRYAKKLGGKLPLAQAELFFKQAAEALDFVHKGAILHRDIKPENILVMNDREIRLADFGVALLPGDPFSMQELESGVGTMDYMAPEVLNGIEYKEAADIYALGVTFYELISGKHPFAEASLAQQIEARKTENLVPLAELVPQIPAALNNAIMRCMQYETATRYKSVREVLEAFSPKAQEQYKVVEQAVAKIRQGKSEAAPAIQEPPAIAPKPARAQPYAPATPLEQEQRHEPKPAAQPERKAIASERSELIAALLGAPSPSGAKPRSSAAPISEQIKAPSVSSHKPIERSEKPKPKPPEPKQPEFDPQRERVGRKPTVLVERETIEQIRPEPEAEQSAIIEPLKDRLGESRVLIENFISEARSNPNRMKRIMLVAGGVVLILALFFMGDGRSRRDNTAADLAVLGDSTESAPETTEDSTQETSSSEVVENKPDTSVSSEIQTQGQRPFPLLSAGIYTGTISDLYPETRVPLTILAFTNRKSLVVIVGIEGWTPQEVSLKSSKAGDPITVASNGIVLKLKASSSSNEEISGEFLNRVTARTGSWRATKQVAASN